MPRTITLSPDWLPSSSFASEEVAAFLKRMHSVAQERPPLSDALASREFYKAFHAERMVEIRRRYPARVKEASLGGVPVQIVEPAEGVEEDKRGRVLINLHGGGFVFGSGDGMLIESVPIAVESGYRVVSVDYRLAPEHIYPAAVDDVEAVYRELLKEYRSESIGIYGCSAGAMLTAQATARILVKHLPRPAAIGMFCGAGLPFVGDSLALGTVAMGGEPPPPRLGEGGPRLDYLRETRADDPVAYPGVAAELLKGFPSTLLLTGGRDFALSPMTMMQRRLAAAGVAAQLVVFDGLWHAFFEYAELPESREAYGIVAAFFQKHLRRE